MLKTTSRIGSQVHAGVLRCQDSTLSVPFDNVRTNVRLGHLFDEYSILAAAPDRVPVDATDGNAGQNDPMAAVAFNQVWARLRWFVKRSSNAHAAILDFDAGARIVANDIVGDMGIAVPSELDTVPSSLFDNVVLNQNEARDPPHVNAVATARNSETFYGRPPHAYEPKSVERGVGAGERRNSLTVENKPIERFGDFDVFHTRAAHQKRVARLDAF